MLLKYYGSLLGVSRSRPTCNPYMIGIGGMATLLYITKNSIGNVPTAFPPSRSWDGDLTAYAHRSFFKLVGGGQRRLGTFNKTSRSHSGGLWRRRRQARL